jgi:hypothetical protein
MRQHRFPVAAGNRDFHPENRLEDGSPMLLSPTPVETGSSLDPLFVALRSAILR